MNLQYFSVFLIISRVGLSALLSQVMSVWVSTEVKTGLVTLTYDVWADESFVTETNFRALGYEIFLSTFIVWIVFFFYEELTVFRGGHMRFPTIGTLVSIFTSVAIMALLWTLETDDFPFALTLSMSKFLTFEATYMQGLEYMGLPWRYKGQCGWKLVC